MPSTEPARESAPSIRPPIVHPMDPRGGENLSPRFAAVLCWLLDLPPTTEPAVTDLSVSSDGCVFLATTEDPFLNTILGSWADLERNLRGWGEACGADTETIEQIVLRALRRNRR